MTQAVEFAEHLERGFIQFIGRPLSGGQILDYGCGWGRHLRLMLRFSPPEKLFGCDAWDQSVDLCKQHNVPATVAQCEYLPVKLPFTSSPKFDLIYAYSVFTHLSELACKAVLGAFKGSIGSSGLVALTVRPEGYWDQHDQAQNAVDAEVMKRNHRQRGFAFQPHKRAPIDGDITYGDTSISLSYMRDAWLDWVVLGSVPTSDQNQILVFLRKSDRSDR